MEIIEQTTITLNKREAFQLLSIAEYISSMQDYADSNKTDDLAELNKMIHIANKLKNTMGSFE